MSNKGRQLAKKLPQTGTCYQDAWRFVIKEGEGYLVHGTVWSEDRRIGHAWVETETGWIWEPETKKFYTDLGFRHDAAPIVQQKYTPEQAAIMAARAKHHGPWSEQERRQYLEGGAKMPQTGTKDIYKVDIDRMGNIWLQRSDDPKKDVFLQFEADKDLVYDLLKKGEREELDKGWPVIIKRSEPRASILDELWDSSARPQRLPQTKGVKPSRPDVEIGTWAERDRIGIWLNDKRTDKTIAEWWDEDAREMFDQGFFKPGDIRHQTITGRAFEDSVLDYAESVGIIAGAGRFLPQTAKKEACYWTAINKDTGEIVESFTPYTSSGRALRSGKIYAARHWKGSTALVEVWKQPHRYSENLKIQPIVSETIRGEGGTQLAQVRRRPSYVPTSYPTLAAELEQNYSLEQLKKMAREKDLSVTGTKRQIIHELIRIRAGEFAREIISK